MFQRKCGFGDAVDRHRLHLPPESLIHIYVVKCDRRTVWHRIPIAIANETGANSERIAHLQLDWFRSALDLRRQVDPQDRYDLFGVRQ